MKLWQSHTHISIFPREGVPSRQCGNSRERFPKLGETPWVHFRQRPLDGFDLGGGILSICRRRPRAFQFRLDGTRPLSGSLCSSGLLSRLDPGKQAKNKERMGLGCRRQPVHAAEVGGLAHNVHATNLRHVQTIICEQRFHE